MLVFFLVMLGREMVESKKVKAGRWGLHNGTTVGIRLPALQFLEIFSYQNFTTLLSEWSTLSHDHSVTGLLVW